MVRRPSVRRQHEFFLIRLAASWRIGCYGLHRSGTCTSTATTCNCKPRTFRRPLRRQKAAAARQAADVRGRLMNSSLEMDSEVSPEASWMLGRWPQGNSGGQQGHEPGRFRAFQTEPGLTTPGRRARLYPSGPEAALQSGLPGGPARSILRSSYVQSFVATRRTLLRLPAIGPATLWLRSSSQVCDTRSLPNLRLACSATRRNPLF